MIRVALVTGARSEYGLLKPLIQNLHESDDFDLSLIATGMHLEEEYGDSLSEIEDDFTINKKIPIGNLDGSNTSVSRSIGEGISQFTNFFEESKPDWTIIMGDRSEIFAVAIASSFLNIPVAHLSGGDTAKAGLDEAVRHSISRFASLHFPATIQSADRLRKMGEQEWRITVSGEPGLDNLNNIDYFSKKQIKENLSLDKLDKFFLLLQHPISTDPFNSGKEFRETILAIKETGIQTIAIYPNSDAGSREIIESLEQLKNDSQFHIFKNLSREMFLSIMKSCEVMIGNSSSAIIESPSFKIPAIDIGSRQYGRERAGNVISSSSNHKSILNAIKLAQSKKFRNQLPKVTNPYGEGNASEIICNTIKDTKISKNLLQKSLSY